MSRVMTMGVRSAGSSALSWLPHGRPLPRDVWVSRHRWVVSILAAQTVGIPFFALTRGFPLSHSLEEAALPAVMVALACWPRPNDVLRGAVAATGLMVVSGIVVHLSGGAIEAHFHFFVMIPIAALYQSWAAFGLAIGFVLFQHGVVGTLHSASVYNHPAAQAHPWLWAGIHASMFAAACLGAIANWKIHERSREAEDDLATTLLYRSHHDALTGLPDRRLFSDRVEQALRAADASGTQPTILLLGLDGFKDVNDTLGHDFGDLLLVEVAARLLASMRANDTVTRFGGDEFAVLLATAGPTGGEEAAERITGALHVPFVLEVGSVDLEVSIGIATAEPGHDGTTLIRNADDAMHVAKQHRLGYARFDLDHDETTTTTSTTNRFNLLGALRHALDTDEIVLHYQPKIALDTGEAIGVEALARWQHPTRGLLAPHEFIPIVESANMCHRFTAHVLETALAQTRLWLDQGICLPVAVNVSSRCLLDTHFPETVAAKLLAANVPGEMLCIEITESTLMVSPARAIDTLHRIRTLGVKVSIDDFGTGYSSMAYLKILPVDELKVDQSFVRDMIGDLRNTVLVQSAIDLGHNLGLTVVAEGVEDAETLSALQDLGCDVIQGFLFARPLPPDDLLTWVTHPSPGHQHHLD